MRVAAVTMVYNEPIFTPIWLRHYGSQVGIDSLYVIDHGSDDYSTADIAANVVRIPRSPMDDKKRASFLSEFCSSLLHWYDAVIYADSDEILIADPGRFGSLVDFCEKTPFDVVTSIGFNIYDQMDGEPLNLLGGLLRQRPWVRFAIPMCKPLVSRKPISWAPGFHDSNHALNFDGLFLFHLRYFDKQALLSKLNKTRSMAWANEVYGSHQRMSDEDSTAMLTAVAGLPRFDGCTFKADDPHVAQFTDWISAFASENPDKRRQMPNLCPIKTQEVLRIPDRFVKIL